MYAGQVEEDAERGNQACGGLGLRLHLVGDHGRLDFVDEFIQGAEILVDKIHAVAFFHQCPFLFVELVFHGRHDENLGKVDAREPSYR